MTRVRVTRTAARSWERDVNHARRDVMTPASLGTSVSLQSLSFFSRGSVRARPKFLAPRAAELGRRRDAARSRALPHANEPPRSLPTQKQHAPSQEETSRGSRDGARGRGAPRPARRRARRDDVITRIPSHPPAARAARSFSSRTFPPRRTRSTPNDADALTILPVLSHRSTAARCARRRSRSRAEQAARTSSFAGRRARIN